MPYSIVRQSQQKMSKTETTRIGNNQKGLPACSRKKPACTPQQESDRSVPYSTTRCFRSRLDWLVQLYYIQEFRSLLFFLQEQNRRWLHQNIQLLYWKSTDVCSSSEFVFCFVLFCFVFSFKLDIYLFSSLYSIFFLTEVSFDLNVH